MVQVKYKRTSNMTRRCAICNSAYRADIEGMIRKGIGPAPIARRYRLVFNKTEGALYQVVQRHVESRHAELTAGSSPIQPIELAPQLNGEAVGPVIDFRTYAKKLLEAGMASEELFTGKRISHTAIISAQRALTDEKKASTQENSLKFSMIKFLRGEGVPEDGAKQLEQGDAD